MIVVDTSALCAVVLSELASEECLRVPQSAPEIVVSAGTTVEVGVVAAMKDVAQAMSDLMSALPIRVVPVDEAMAERAVEAFRPVRQG